MRKTRRPGRSSEIRNRGPRESWRVWSSHSGGDSRRPCLLITAGGEAPLPICLIEGKMRESLPIARKFIAGKVALSDVVDFSDITWRWLPLWFAKMVLRPSTFRPDESTGAARGRWLAITR